MSEVLGEWTPHQEQLDMWAALSGDRNPLHVDPKRARQSSFGGTIAHGHLTIAIMVEHLHALTGCSWVTHGRLQDVEFTAPVRPETFHTFEIDPSVAALRAGSVCVIMVRNQSGEICVTGQAQLLMDR